jgi:glycerate kinase
MIVIAPTSFKGTLSAAAAARAMAAGAREVTSLPIHIQPLSDGGPGLIDALVLTEDVVHQVRVRGPLNADVDARILVRFGTAVVESADACGLHLVPEARRDPTVLTTWGVGELIAAASELAVDRIVVGLGGSATVDGGLGMRDALRGKPIAQSITALADVSTTLVDAARVFGPQKGASRAQVGLLEERLANLLKQTGVADFPGAGAAGGLGYGLRAFLNAEVLRGSEWVIAQTGIAAAIANASAVITGEGEFDDQSFMGKITGALIELAESKRVPILVVAGRSARVPGYEHVAHGDGAMLGESDLQRLVRDHLPALLHH